MSVSSQSSNAYSQTTIETARFGGVHGLVFWLALASSLWAAIANAADVSDASRYRFLVDAKAELQTPSQALAALRQEAAPQLTAQSDPLFISKGLRNHPVWFVTPVPDGTTFITISGGWRKHYSVSFVAGDQVLSTYESGATNAAANRPIPDPRSVFRVPEGANPVALLIHHNSTSSNAQYPIEFQSEAEYLRGARLLHLRHGAYYGLMALVLCFSFGASLAQRRPASIYFVIYLLSSAVLLGCQDGFLGFYLLPNSPALVLALTHVSLGFVLMSTLLFGLYFLRLDVLRPRLTQGLKLVAAALAIHGFVNAFFQSQLGTIVEMACSLAVGIALICAAVIATRCQVTGARIYLLSRFPVFVATTALIVNDWLLQSITVSGEALFIGATLEMLLLTVAVVVRMAAEQQNSEAARTREKAMGAQINQLQLVTDEANQLRSVQHSVQEVHRVRTINQIAGGVAHDFNNIFTSVIGFAELLRAADLNLTDEQRRKFGSEIYTAGERGAQLVQQLLIYSRSAKPNAESHNVAAITEEALSLARSSLPKGIVLQVELPDTPTTGVLDANQWRQVIVNLIANAGEAMQGVGTIDVRLQKATISSRQCSSCLHAFSGERIILTISDEGGGVDEPVSDLFTPFHTTKAIGNGSGLGLSVVDGIVHEHGGHLVVTNRSSRRGVRVEVALPSDLKHPATSRQQSQLLLVRSDSDAVDAAQEKLQRYYQVTTADRASSAISTFLDNRARFGLVAIEVQPDSDQWLEIASNIRRSNPNTPILFLSPDAQASTILRQQGELQHSQTTQVLNLTTDFDSLLATVESLLKPGANETHNITSLRDALRRLQKQTP